MTKKKISYKGSGVDIQKADDLVKSIKSMTKSTRRAGVAGGIGGFASLFHVPKNIKNPLIVSSTDGIGTKLLLAQYQNRFDTIGIDLVAMCVNDLICVGAEPLFFLDYYATGKLNLKKSEQLMRGITKACKESNCSLIGGETAEMPGVYKKDDFDLAGFSCGIVDEKKIIDGKKVKAGDVIIGLASSGVHSNGFSLVRKLFSKRELTGTWGKKLLAPTKLYVKPVLSLVKKDYIKAAAHITGGGFYENIPRVLPKGKSAVIDKSSWTTPTLFKTLEKRSGLSEKEMFTTFNMGIGMILVVSKKNAPKALSSLKRSKTKAYLLGQIKTGKKKVDLV